MLNENTSDQSQYRRRIYSLLLLTVLAISLGGCFDRESKEETARPYKEGIDYNREIATALHELKSNQRLMLIFGANWCPTCRRVDASLMQPEISGYLQEHFKIMKVNIGNFDKNLDIAYRFKLPIKQGIPAIVFVNKNKTVSAYIKTLELSALHAKGRKTFYKRLKQI